MNQVIVVTMDIFVLNVEFTETKMSN